MIVGCRPAIVEREHVFSEDSRHRLTLRYETFDRRGFDFHDLVLEKKSDAGWVPVQTVWKGDAILPPDRRRWVSKLHSLDADRQTAIIQIGTESPREGQGVITVEYAWVRWDLAKNGMLEQLRVCDDPFAPIDE